MRRARDTARSERAASAPAVELTPADIANGWTPETLAEHVAQAEQREHSALMNRLFPEKQPLTVETVATYDPHGW